MSPAPPEIHEHYPGALRTGDYLQKVRDALTRRDVSVDSTLASVCTCRDELAGAFGLHVRGIWGPVFDVASLGGVPAMGPAGWVSALGHIPDTHGRGCLLAFGLSHIGIDGDGTLGFVTRAGQDRPNPACGALSVLLESARQGDVPTAIDPDDFEATRLGLRLIDRSAVPSLAELTATAADTSGADLWTALDEVGLWQDHDVAVCWGTQIHGPDGTEWISHRGAWFASSDGVRQPLDVE
ncbi:MAG: hypothetical protein R2698_05425 [Microthrixaceae bacterium]